MPTLRWDIESRSAAKLDDVGARRYASDPTTSVLCVCYAVDDGPVESYVPGEGPIPDVFYEAARNPDWKASSHNAPFEHAIAEFVLAPRFGWPLVPIERHSCTMAMARYHGLPGGLDKVAKLLGLPVQKDAEGRRLMLQLCKPRRPRKGEDPTKIYWVEITPEKLARLIAYCKRDVEIERALCHLLSSLPEGEMRLWLLDQKINSRGFCADLEFCAAADKLAAAEKPRINGELARLTDGTVTSFTQTAGLRAFVNARGHDMKNFDKKAVAAVLAGNPDNIVRELLELRQQGANTSVTKYAAALASAFPDQRIRGALTYYGAHTGRWSGSGLNVHNFPREDSADALAAIDAVRRGDLEAVRKFGPPIEVMGRLTRGVVTARRPDKLLMSGDFSTIEPRGASWLSGEAWKLDTFREFDRTGDPMLDAHRVVGAQMRGQPVDPTDDAQRQRGKIVHMALNYGGSVNVWRKFVPDDPRSDAEIKAQEINKFRALHPKQTTLMYTLERQALQCVYDRQSIVGDRYSFEMDGDTLVLRLPSGRPLFYPRARLEPGRFGKNVVRYHNPAWNADDDMWYGSWLAHLVSATSRDLMVNALFKLDTAGFDVVLHVHDEVVAEVDAGSSETLKAQFQACMEDSPAWAAGLPLAVKVRVGERYIKADTERAAATSKTPAPEIVLPIEPAVATSAAGEPPIAPEGKRNGVHAAVVARVPASITFEVPETTTAIDLADLVGCEVPKNRKLLCPFHDEKTPSLHVYTDHYYCFSCHRFGDHLDWLTQVEGLSLTEAQEKLTNWAGPVISQTAARGEPTAEDIEEIEKKRCYALDWWDAGRPIRGTLAARYLEETRGVDLDFLPDNVDEALRFHPKCVFGFGDRQPCLMALMRDPRGDAPIGIQRIALTPDAQKVDRRMLGISGVVKLWPAGSRLAVGEGLETVLAAATRLPYRGEPLRPAWAALSDGALKTFPLIDGVERLIVLADNDTNHAGQEAAEACKRRWLEARRRVAVLTPERPGTDFNDVVLRRTTDRLNGERAFKAMMERNHE